VRVAEPKTDAVPDAFESPFLATKIALPKVGARWIDRPRLIDRLGVPPNARVTLLHAGPGFGKTACLAQWQKRLAPAGVRVAWYTVEQDDNDVATFIGYVAAALNVADGAIGADVMELARSGPMPRSGTLVTRLLNQVAVSHQRYALIIDDYHFMQSSAVDETLSQLIAHAPDNLDVAVASRGMPNLRLGKLRAEGKVIELGPETLGLTRAETGAFVEAMLGAALPPRDVTQLQTLSEGWPAVLQIMLVALGSKKHLHQLVRAFTGEARVLREYLAQEAFEGLPAETQQFLLRSSVLTRFCAELCEYVTGAQEGAQAIADVERRQLLIVALDTQGRWFRYHPLFAEFLQGQLRAREPEAAAELHRRASEWFERNGLWAEAVRNALAAGDEARALDIIDRCAMTLIEQGEYVTLLDWLARFPTNAVRVRPQLLAAQAWAMALTMRHQEAGEVLDVLQAFPASELPPDRDFAGEIALARGGMALLEDDFRDVAFLDIWPAHSARSGWIRDIHKSLTAYTLIMRREYRRARDFAPCETPLKIVYQKMLNGLAWWREGDGLEAESALTDALEFADAEFGAHSVAAALTRAIAARVFYERGDWREAEEALDQRLPVIEQSGPLDWLWSAYSTLASALATGGRKAEALSLLERGCEIAQQRAWLRLEAALHVDLLRLGAAGLSSERLRALAASAADATLAGRETLFLCELGIGYEAARTRIGSAGATQIAKAIERYGPDGCAFLRAQAHLLLAQALVEAGRSEEALKPLTQSLAIGERLRLGQTYRDAGTDVVRLLASIAVPAGARPSKSYLELVGNTPGGDATDAPSRKDSERTIGSLSEREREILMLVGRGMSNKEIGRSLRIGPETVKWHLKNLFAKLEVPNRIQAVNRARGLSMIA